MKILKHLIIFSVFLAACCDNPQPNQDLLSAYEFVKKGEFDAAKTIAKNTSCLTDADSALFRIVREVACVNENDWNYNDSLDIEKNINFFEGDDEKSAWAHLCKSSYLYRFGYWDKAAVEGRNAEKLAENTDCDELKFLIYFQLALCNINSYNFDFYDEAVEKMQKYAVTNNNRANYYYLKCFGYDLGRLNLDSAKYYAKKAVECIENEPIKNMTDVFFYYKYAELVCDEDDSTAEKYIKKSMEFDTLRQAYSVLGKIYLKRGDANTATQYFEKSSNGNYWCENEEKINRWLHEFFAEKEDYKAAYGYSLKRIAAKDSIINYLEDNDIKPVQTRFEGELKNLKLKTAFDRKIFMIILISSVILAVLFLMVVFQKLKLSERSRKISDAQRTINDYNQKINKLQKSNTDRNNEEIKFLLQKIRALEMKFSDIYVHGKELYNQIINGQKIGRWSKDDYKNFIDYYQSIDFMFVYSFETDYIRLSDRQKIFLILCHIGKTKEEIMQIMTLEDGSFRSMKSRVEKQKNNC